MKTIKFLLIFIFMTAFSVMVNAQVVRYWAYCDKDGDGHACPQKLKEIPADKVFYYLDQGWLVANHKPALDCDDDNDQLFHNKKVWVDADGDKYVNGYVFLCIGTAPPAGYIMEADKLGNDCNDADPLVWKNMTLYFDRDGDGHTPGPSGDYCVGLPATYPPMYIDKSMVKGYLDCDDNDPLVWRNVCIRPIHTPKPYLENTSACVGMTPPPGYEFCDGTTSPATIEYSVYPNPVTDRLNITPNENWNNRVEISMVDQFGRVARVVNSPSAIKGQVISINTGDLKPGIYQLIIRSGELLSTKPIAVKL
jgi:hypothetical protein